MQLWVFTDGLCILAVPWWGLSGFSLLSFMFLDVELYFVVILSSCISLFDFVILVVEYFFGCFIFVSWRRVILCW
jgi:hypothetical protein